MTKQVYCLFLATLLFCSSSVSAQSFTTKLFSKSTKWQVKRIGLTFGVDQDMISGLDDQHLLSLMGSDARSRYADIDFDEQYKYAGICENPHLRFSLSLASIAMPNTEINLAVNAIFNRNDGVSYYNHDNKLGSSSYLSFDAYGSELNADISIVKSKTVWNTFRFYGGLGTNLGYAFDNHLSISASDYRTVLDYSLLETGQIGTPSSIDVMTEGEDYFEYYDTHRVADGISQRLFAQAGMSIIALRRLELGLEGRLGYGYRLHFGRNITGARHQSIGFTARWILGKDRDSRLF